jgi:hypothetical protein
MTSATCGCEIETRLARSAKRNTIDLLTVTEIVGAACGWAASFEAGANSNTTSANANLLRRRQTEPGYPMSHFLPD